MRLSQGVRQTSLSLIYSQCSHVNCLIYVAIESYLSRKYVLFQNDYHLIARGWRQVRDACDDFATILRGSLWHKFFEHVRNFHNYFAPLDDTCEEIMHHRRLFYAPLAMSVAKQSQSSVIGA